jgi:hypothetical protein
MDAIAAQVYDAQKAIFKSKGVEYTEGNDDALYNFKQVAHTLGLTPAQVAWVYFEKHLAAIRYAMKHPVLSEPLIGRITDACTYLLLLYGLWAESAQGEEEQSEGPRSCKDCPCASGCPFNEGA